MRTPVIDFHIHPICYEKYCFSSEEWIKQRHQKSDEEWQDFIKYYSEPYNFTQYLRDNGVDYGIILAELSPITTGICPNEYVAGFTRGQDRLIPFASLNPFLIGNPRQELSRLVSENGFRGLKIYPTYHYFYPNDRLLYPIYAKAEELQIPVMVHTGSSVFRGARLEYGDPLFLDDVAVDFPGIQIVLVHSGRGFWYNHAFFLASLHSNIYMEVAGLPPQKLLHYFPELERNADKIIFGSDWPGVTSIRSNIETLRELPLESSTKEKILGGNADRILKLKDC
ncbi:metal-dependent hydrolase [Clostridiales bacterium PH28_bin88]|nr:metal-dependent hydrolase [Clostridiales bacterium PH28_bin88]